MIAVEVSGLVKRHGATMILDNVSFSLGKGVVYGLIGSNGSGKSTLLRILATLERPTAGRVTILGKDILAAPKEIRRSIGFVPDEQGVDPGLTVAEHLDFMAGCYGLSRKERFAGTETMLQLLDLDASRGKLVAELSRGLRQRLALATAMVHNPEVLLLDEPLAALDAIGRSEMKEVLRELQAMGKTMVVSSNSVDDVRTLCDAVGIVHRGRLLVSGPLADVLTDAEPKEMLVRIDVNNGVEAAQSTLSQRKEIHQVSTESGRFTFVFDGDSSALSCLLDSLVGAGVQISQFTTLKPGLEDVLVRTMQEYRG